MAAATMYVTVAGAGDKSGTEWAKAMGLAEFKTDAEGSSEAGDVYYVMSGTYTLTGNFWVNGRSGTTASPIRIVGVSDEALTLAQGTDRPLIAAGGYYWLWYASFWHFDNLRVTGTASFQSYSNGTVKWHNYSAIQTSGTAGRIAITGSGAGSCVTKSYAKSTNGTGIQVDGGIFDCFVEDCGQTGINSNCTGSTERVIVSGCGTGWIDTGGYGPLLTHSVFYDCTTGISLSTNINQVVVNNLIDSCTTGILSTSSIPMRHIDYNNFHGNTTDRTNVTAGDHDTADDPQFVNAGAGDFTLTAGSPCLTAGMPVTLGVATSVTTHQGAVPPVAGGGGPVRSPIGMTGGMSV